MPTLANMPTEAFNAIALLYIYHHIDLAYPGVDKASRRREKLRAAQKHGYLTGIKDPEDAGCEAKELYDSVIEYWIGQLPPGWGPTHDFWGAKCAAYHPGWDAPKTGTLFAGDKNGHYAAFDSSDAVSTYLKEKLPKIHELQAQREASAQAAGEA